MDAMERALLEQIEANSARSLLLSERTARLLLTLTEKDELRPDDYLRQLTKGRLGLSEALGMRG